MEKVTTKQLKKAIDSVIESGFTSHAVFGASGNNIVLFGIERKSSISVRLHSSGIELLICNESHEFLFYGKYHPKLGSEFIAKKFNKIINSIGYELILSDRVESKIPKLQ